MKTNFGTNKEQLTRAHNAREMLGYIDVPLEKILSRRDQQLPEDTVTLLKSLDRGERNNYLRQLSRAGWTGSALARALGLSRQAIAPNLKDVQDEEDLSLPIPLPPTKRISIREPYTYPTAESLTRLQELQPIAKLVRTNSPKYREEAEEYTALLNKVVTEEGVTVYRLAKILGVTPTAIASRLVRYGYKTSELGETKMFIPIREANRVRA